MRPVIPLIFPLQGVIQMTYMSSKANLSSSSFRKENGKTYQNEGKIMRDSKVVKQGKRNLHCTKIELLF